MKRFLILALLCAAAAGHAQTNAPMNLLYAWTTPTTTGQLQQYLNFNQTNTPPPSNYSIDWSLNGTAPSACTFRVEGSWDAVNWYGLDTTSPASTPCITSNMESIAYKPVRYLRINLVTYTAGDGTTQVIFHYTGGRN